MENRDEIERHIQHASDRLRNALHDAPKCSNLSDTLETLIGALDELQSAVQGNEYDAAGMEK